jgi:hypothetical protein
VISPRVSIATGIGAAAAAGLILAGRTPGSVPVALALVVGARAAAAASSSEPLAARALGRQMSLVPAWVGIALVAIVRAGSPDLGAVRGANAVLGLALAHGSTLVVAGAVVGSLAGVATLVASAPAFRVELGTASGRLEMLALLLQVWLITSLFAGPQVRAASDAIPWVVASVVALGAAIAGARYGKWERTTSIATLLAAIAVALVLVGARA